MLDSRLYLLAAVMILVYGCASPVSYSVTDDYEELAPRKIVVLPVSGDFKTKLEPGAAEFLRAAVVDRLREKNYSVVFAEGPYADYPGGGVIDAATFSDIASRFDADAILYGGLVGWEEKSTPVYASLSIKVAFGLYSTSGEELWNASYKTKESEASLDESSMELAVLKAYEPRIERAVEAVFRTLPALKSGSSREESEKRYYDWLP